jgi:SAM-dependent methyltransferase
MGGVTHSPVTDVSPNDAMFNLWPHLDDYLKNGRSALDCVLRGLESARAEHPATILDFACGHGRVTRHLAAAFPEAELTACDIDEDGVEFCVRTFGARGVVSSSDPRSIDLGGLFDLIWSGSLFTHLDVPKWREFFALLRSVLTRGGVVVFTTHGRHAAAQIRTHETDQHMFDSYDRTGFGWAHKPLKYPGHPELGASVSTLEWTCGFLEGVGLPVVWGGERAWDGFQDAVAARRP